MDALHGRWLNGCCEQYWTSPWGNIPQSTNCTATYLPSRKLSKLDEPDIQDTAGDAGTSSLVMFSYGPLHMAKQNQGDQLESTYSSSVRIRDVALRTCQKRCTIGRSGERGSCGTTWWWCWYLVLRSIRQFKSINKKYVHKICLLCSIKYVSMKKCYQYIKKRIEYTH